jgi:FtsP/CotA-like multicopper oxidase with cupredoxin domain
MEIQLKRATQAEWLAIDPVLAVGEVGVETDTRLFKIGNGVKKWSDLDYDGQASGSFTECRPLLIGGVPAVPGDIAPDQFEPPKRHNASVVDEKRLVLNGSAEPTTVGDIDASFGGIVLKGFRDHFWLYDYANNAWNTSDNINLSCETGLLIDNRKALDEQKVRVGNRTKGGKVYLGSGEHDTWRLGTDDHGDLLIEYRRLDGQWIEKKKYTLTPTDKGHGLIEAENPYIEHIDEPAKKPAVFSSASNLGKMSWPLYETPAGHSTLHVKLFLNTDDAFALGRIMKRTANFNGVIPGPMLKVKAGHTIEVDFYNELDDLGELEPWNDGMMQRHEMTHMHLDDRTYAFDGTIDDNSPQALKDANELALQKGTTWMQHIMARGLTNLHTHGFHVRPDGFGDNVLRSVKPGSKLRYRYKLPSNHFGGLQWFHPHGHGGSTNIVGRGAIGTILVEGPYQERLNANHVEREFVILQRIQWGENLNGQDELNWVDYVSNLPLDMYNPDATPDPAADNQKTSLVLVRDLSPYYKDNLDPKCICSCAALGGSPHVHGTSSIATPSCDPVDIRWVPSVNGQKKPVFSAKTGELKIFSMLNGTGITFFRIAIKDHDIVIAGRDGIPQVSSAAMSANSVDPDFVRIPAGQRINYVMCHSGQRFEFFIIPKAGIVVADGSDYPVYMLPVSETEIFSDGLDAPVQIATLRYTGTLNQAAPNHVSKLVSLLPQVALDDPNHTINPDKAVFPIDRTNWHYIETFTQLAGLIPTTEATVTGATLSVAGLKATIVMPSDQPHHLEVDTEIRIGGTTYVIDSLDADLATFHIVLPQVTQSGSLPAPGFVDFTYNLFKESTVNNTSTGNIDKKIFEILTDHFYYRDIPLDTTLLKPYIARRRFMSFAIHKQGLAGSGSDSTFMNGSAFNDFNRTVGYLGTNEEIIIENRSDVIHLFHIHINYYQVMGYRDGVFGDNAVTNPVVADNSEYAFATEIPVPFEGFEDTTSIPVGKIENSIVADEANEGSRGQVRVRISHEDYTGLFLMHCHLLDDQDMGMMQEVEVVAPGYVQAPFSAHVHTAG